MREAWPVSAAVAAADVVSERVRAEWNADLERSFGVITQPRRSARAEVLLRKYLRGVLARAGRAFGDGLMPRG